MKGTDPCREIKVVTVREEPARFGRSGKLDEPGHIFRFWNSAVARSAWYHEDKEHLVTLCVDARYQLKTFSLVGMGTLNGCLAHPREIFRPAIADSAHSIVIAHNHPSGDPNPSRLDLRLTRQLYLCGEILQIPLLDHVIIGDGKYFSFREVRGLWPENERDAFRLEKTLGKEFRARKRKRPARRSQAGPSTNGARKPLGKNREVRQRIFGCLEQIKVGRFVTVHLTEMQWLQMKATHSESSVKQFLATATHAQLFKLRHTTPVRFEVTCRKRKGRSTARFVFVRDLKRSEAANKDWARLTFQRRLVASALKLRGIKQKIGGKTRK